MLRPLRAILPPLLKKPFQKRGLADGTLILDWETIVGPQTAQYCRPEKIVFPKGVRTQGTLFLTVPSAWVALITHGYPVLLERINQYYGYAALKEIKVHQRVGAFKRLVAPTQINQDLQPCPQVDQTLSSFPDSPLKAALQELGQAIYAGLKKGD
jgi:hypothetical protein